MKAKLKMGIYFILEFILSILLLILLFLVILKTTIYSEKFMLKAYADNNYYNTIYNDIKEEMSNTIIPTGLPEEVLEDLFTEEDIKKEIEQAIHNIYSGEKIVIETKTVSVNLNNNVNKYLEKNFLEVTDEDNLEALEDQMVGIYKKHMTQANLFKKVQKVIRKTQNLVLLAIITVAAISLVIAIVVRIVLNKNLLNIPLFTAGSLLLVVYFYITSNININNILIWSKATSNVLHSIGNGVLKSTFIFGIIAIILGVLDCLIDRKQIASEVKIKKSKKEK